MKSFYYKTFQRDSKVYLSRSSSFLGPIVFFLITITLYPLAFGSDEEQLAELASGIIWISILLANLSIKILTLSVALIVIVYILLKLIVPSWKLTYEKAKKLVFLMGGFGGVLQGTAGLSAPISITFLNSMKLERNQFIPTISVYFGVMSIFQMPTLYYYNFLNLEIVLVSCISTLVLLSFMPIGSWIAKSVSKESFDKITLILLGFIAFRIIYLNF